MMNDSNERLATRILRWFIGPGKLGSRGGLLVGALVVGYSVWSSEMVDHKQWVFRAFFGVMLGYFGGGLGGLMGREELFVESWRTHHRPLYGLGGGALIGGGFSLLFCDVWVFLAAALGGGIGGFTETYFHQDTLEEGW